MEIDNSERPQSTISRIANFFRGKSSANKTLSKWKQSGEQEEWSAKAVDTLVKKLKKQPNGLKNLQDALISKSGTSKCVTIPRSIDGRLQVSNCKALPHVIYGRVWRWPDLQSHHELKAVKSCEYPFSARKTDICINPYHYERVENNSMLPPILVPRQNEFAPGYSLLPAQQMPAAPPQPQYNSNYANNGFGPINGYDATNGFSTNSCSSGQNSPMSSIAPNSPAAFQQQTYQFPTINGTPSPPFCQENVAYMQQQPPQQQQQQYIEPEVEQVHYTEPEYWANVAYYELNYRVGEQFRCNTNSYSLTIDGFTHPSCNTSNRFCLGQLSNVNRNSTIEATRKHIGKGVQVFFRNNELFIECLSESPIFVHSLMANKLHDLEPGRVCKIQSGQQWKIFDTNEFATMLGEVVYSGFEASYALTRMCTIRISFVKGWGSNYHRQDVTSTPCWIEIHLNGPLKWLYEVLSKMGSPLWAVSSVS